MFHLQSNFRLKMHKSMAAMSNILIPQFHKYALAVSKYSLNLICCGYFAAFSIL